MKKIALACSVLFVSLILTACSRTPGQFDELAQCITDKGIKMYGTNTCPYCIAQKESFKGSFDLIDFVECTIYPAECQKVGLEGYPTWLIDGKKHAGKKSLSELSELSGCELRPSKVTADDASSDSEALPE